jgi:hypothetical protein
MSRKAAFAMHWKKDARMLKEALEYAARGWRIHPLETGGKKPRLKGWPKKATTDPDTIKKWWSDWPDANIGLACGKESGVFVLDVDGEKGKATFNEMQDASWATLTAATGGGGYHLFYVYPNGGTVIRNKQNFKPGLDIRGDGGYVVLPPSIHESGKPYGWKDANGPVSSCPSDLLAMLAPKKRVMPWEKSQTATTEPPRKAHGTPILERAALYLRECEAAVQGAGGHNALLWAARALVIGFELSDGDALALLWSEFNPRCSPPWGNSPSEAKDFERKVAEARRTPGEKPAGWLLDEYGLRSDDSALAALGARLKEGLLAGQPAEKQTILYDPVKANLDQPRPEFPLHCFPVKVREYIETVADVQVVDPASVALSVLVTAGAAMGNTFILRLKRGYEVRPILWGVVVAASGTNKTGPFREIIKPLRAPVPMELRDEAMVNPQGQLLIEDATTESVIDVLSRSPRGLCLANGELAGWVGAFDRYSQGGGRGKASVDESIWLKMWDGDAYQKNRKTDQESLSIPAASCAVVGCIQPKKLAECFDPSQFASGLVPRLLVINVPKRFRGWSETEMLDHHSEFWHDTIMRLRSAPFANVNTDTGAFVSRVVKLSPTAKSRFVKEYNRIGAEITKADDVACLFLGKSQGMTGRIALVLHGLGAAAGEYDIDAKLSRQTMEAAIELMRYLLAEQLHVYGLAGEAHERKRVTELVDLAKASGGKLRPRNLMRLSQKRWPTATAAKHELDRLVEAKIGFWSKPDKEFSLCTG